VTDASRITAVPLAPTRAEAAIGVLARAFQRDPMMTHFVPDPERRTRWLPHFLGTVTRYCLANGTVTTTPDVAGAACWLPPGATDVSTARLVRHGMARAVPGLGLRGLRRMGPVLQALERGHRDSAPEPHWWLWLLGTEPARTGQGVASRVLAPVLAQADANGTPAFLDTQLEANLGFYARHRFEPVVSGEVDGLRWWGLRREPRAPL
jgi:GNAT superfamily N-acetyltransferase